jgi:hypothetical protein
MWRTAYAVVSALVLTLTFAATVVADSHPAQPATTGGGGATQPVTAVPSTGIGMMTDRAPSALVLGLLALTALLAVMAMTMWRRQEA